MDKRWNKNRPTAFWCHLRWWWCAYQSLESSSSSTLSSSSSQPVNWLLLQLRSAFIDITLRMWKHPAVLGRYSRHLNFTRLQHCNASCNTNATNETIVIVATSYTPVGLYTFIAHRFLYISATPMNYKMLSYRRETELQGSL